jgi:hypothetical protein
MAASLTTLSNIMKEFYVGPIQDQFNNEILITQLLPMDAENLEGLEAVIPLHTSRSGGIGARGENVQLPAASNQGYKQAKYDLKYHYAAVQVSGPAISKTKSDAGAFAQALKSELDRIKDDVMLDFARQLYGTGDGVIDSIPTAAAANATQTLSSVEQIQKGLVYVGMVIDIGTVVNPTASATGKTITDVDFTAGTITLDAAVTPTNGDKIFRTGNNTASATYEMDAGLQKLLPTAANTVGGLNAASAGNKIWDNLRDTAGGAISLDNLMIDYNKANQFGAKADELACLTTPGIVRRLFATSDFKANVRFVNSETLQGGFEAISFNAGGGNVRLYADRLHPWGKVHFVHKKHFRLFSPADWDFLSRDGLTVRWVTNFDAFQAILFRYANLGTDRRNTSLVMSGLTDTGY